MSKKKEEESTAPPHDLTQEEVETIDLSDAENIRQKKTLRHVDSLNLEAGRVTRGGGHGSQFGWGTTLFLAFKSIGIVYGDIGTSPLYVFSSIFSNGIAHKEDVVSALSIIYWTLVLIPLVKYVLIVLWANDNGDGGTFALYSLICRYAKVGLIPNTQPEDKGVSNYQLETPSSAAGRALKIKKQLEGSYSTRIALFVITILGTTMVIGDGVLTPCISVLSAVSGIKKLGPEAVMWISVVILILLFSVQRFGTDKVGVAFAPILVAWFGIITAIGLFNLIKYDITVLRAVNPQYIIEYFIRNNREAWISLGGCVMCITGAEAMFADLGHFTVRSIQVSFSGCVFPALLFAYSGQAAYLVKNPGDVSDAFYASVPDPVYWPVFVVAVLAAIIASQAMISGTFSIIAQSLSLSCFPRVKVVHTSPNHEGQVYIPEINYLLMICCVIVTLVFKNTEDIGHAYGIAVVAVMVISTGMVTLIMLVIWKTSVWWIALFCGVFMFIELIYLSAVLYKFTQGGYLPVAFSLVVMAIMGIWHYVQMEKYVFELEHKVSSDHVKEIVVKRNLHRVPGIAFLYSELVQGIPPIFPHFLSSIPSIHSVIVFVSVKKLPIRKVVLEERFLFRQVEPREHNMFRCVARYGYRDRMEGPEEFEQQLVDHLIDFIRQEGMMARVDGEENEGPNVEEQVQFVHRAKGDGVVYLLGEADVMAKENSSLFKRMIVDYFYRFLRKNCRQCEEVLAVPRKRLLRVGMMYEV